MWPTRVSALVLLSVSVAAIGCGGTQAPSKAPDPPEVYVTTPTRSKIIDYEIFTGRTESPETIDVRSRVTGYLNWTHFKEGGEVIPGEVLAEIDPRTYKAQYEQAEAQLVQAIAHRDRLLRDYERDSALARKGNTAISASDYDKTVGDYKEAEAAVKSAQATRNLTKVNYDYCTITVPLGTPPDPKRSWRISRRVIDPGALVKADDTIITTIVRTDKMYVYFDVDERTLLKLRRLKEEGKFKTTSEEDTMVKMGLADEDGFPHEGSIDFEDNRVDALTGTLRMRGVFPNPKRLLSPGLFARVQLPVSPRHEAILIPEQALSTDQGQKFLYIVDDHDEVVYRQVKIGALHDGYRVIEEGLQEGERVIVSGLQRARRGIKVTPKPATKAHLPSPHSPSPTAPPIVIKDRPGNEGTRPAQQPSNSGGR